MILGVHFGQAGKDAVAAAQRRVALAGDQQDARRFVFALPFQRLGEQIAIGRRVQHLQNRDRRHLVRVAIGLAAFLQMPLGLKFLEDAFQVDPVRPLDAERLGDVTLGGQGGVLGNPVENLVFGGDLAHVFGLA